MSVRDTNNDWKEIADKDPYWGVLSVEDFRGVELSEKTSQRFFASGNRYVSSLLGLINKYLNEVPITGRALDFGCGVGRLAIPLARHFKEVVGVDIAEGMLTLASANAAKADVRNITLVRSDDSLSEVTGQFDLVNTLIVLQHIPPERGLRLVRRLIERTRVGGIASLQLTYARERRFLPHEAARARYYRRDGAAMIDIGKTEAEHPPGTITMFDYDLNEIFAILGEFAGHPILSLPTNDDGHLGVHLVFKRAR
jgi:SAM-dependent methyltransferase